MHARISALLLAFVLAVAGLATAQETTGTISGRILDAQGLAVPGATVTVTGPQGSKTVVTDSTGRFRARTKRIHLQLCNARGAHN